MITQGLNTKAASGLVAFELNATTFLPSEVVVVGPQPPLPTRIGPTLGVPTDITLFVRRRQWIREDFQGWTTGPQRGVILAFLRDLSGSTSNAVTWRVSERGEVVDHHEILITGHSPWLLVEVFWASTNAKAAELGLSFSALEYTDIVRFKEKLALGLQSLLVSLSN